MAGEFWSSEEQFGRLVPLLPTDTRGMARVDDRRVISGIVHALLSGGRWVDLQASQPRRTGLLPHQAFPPRRHRYDKLAATYAAAISLAAIITWWI